MWRVSECRYGVRRSAGIGVGVEDACMNDGVLQQRKKDVGVEAYYGNGRIV